MGHVIVYPIGCILGRASCTKENYPIFVTLWVSVKGTQLYGIELPNIHKFSVG